MLMMVSRLRLQLRLIRALSTDVRRLSCRHRRVEAGQRRDQVAPSPGDVLLLMKAEITFTCYIFGQPCILKHFLPPHHLC